MIFLFNCLISFVFKFMPLGSTFSIYPSGDLLLWKVEEESNWFKDQLDLAPSLWSEYDSLANAIVRYRWLASRYALQLVSQQSPLEIFKDEFGKPFLGVQKMPMSLSHCEGFVAAIRADVAVGIDVERVSSRVEKIKNYFLRGEELDLLGENVEGLILAWSAKESIFKWFGHKRLGYKSQVCIKSYDSINRILEIEINTETHNLIQPVFYCQDSDKVLTWTIGG
jgi:4'-phosphopantetheinyl transferase